MATAERVALQNPVIGRPEAGLGHYLRDVVYGALDGVITRLAVVAGTIGADLGPRVGVIGAGEWPSSSAAPSPLTGQTDLPREAGTGLAHAVHQVSRNKR
jgi:hypothetical protein